MPLALVVSPIRSWPLDQGNRVRILTIGNMLRERGYTVHFLLSELEGGRNHEEREIMSRQWAQVRTVPYKHNRVQAYAESWGGDDWYDPAVSTAAREMAAMWDYDLCVVNYAWYSSVLDALPDDVVGIIDTHDAFGDRHKRLYEAGTSPEWYFTRPEDEGRCLDRADIVIAIQEEEEAWFKGLTDKTVKTVGHVAPAVFLPPRARQGGKLRGAYLASGNPSNQLSINTLIQHWAADPFLAQNVELHVAGPICRHLEQAPGFVIRHGFVPDIEAFFAITDFAVNPNVGGSGLKIKSVEALSYGRPLFATAEGMLGISKVDLPYVSTNVAEMATQMSQAIAADPDLDTARIWARATCLAYRSRQIDSFDAVLAEANSLLKTPRKKSRHIAGDAA